MSVLTCFGIKPRKTKKLKLNSLPDEMLVNIFKYLDCRSLRSVRLVAKRFYYIIDNNITKMQRPKVEYLNISDRDIFFHVYADLIYTRFDNNIVTIRQLKVEEENKLIGYFKYIDTEEMKNLNVSCHKDPKIFMFLGRVFKDGFSVKTLHLSIERDECFDYVGKLFDNIKSFKIVYFEPFFSNSNKIQSKVLPLVLTSLEKNGIYQFKGKNMGLSPVIKYLIGNHYIMNSISIEHLPDELLSNIFSYVDWKTLKNVKLTSRRFYYVTTYNQERMIKPEVDEILLNNTEYNMCMECSYGYRNAENELDSRKVVDVRDNEIGKIVKNLKITKASRIRICITKNVQMFQLLSSLFEEGIVAYSLTISVKETQGYEGLIMLLGKIKHIEILSIYPLCLLSQEVPDFITLPCIKTLTTFDIYECPCTNFANKGMIEKLINENTELYTLSLYTNRYCLSQELINTVKRTPMVMDSNNKTCVDHDFSFEFGTTNFANTKNMIEAYFSKDRCSFDAVYDIMLDILKLSISVACKNCNEDKVININVDERFIFSSQYCPRGVEIMYQKLNE
uniref:F-box domain-containing protein n=1 Tax=Parastrongyloides trichosuri TaxID=131310 RepID=A0A0N4ZY59_PARTI